MRIVVDHSVQGNFIDVETCRITSRESAEKLLHALKTQIEELWPKHKQKKAEQS